MQREHKEKIGKKSCMEMQKNKIKLKMMEGKEIMKKK